MIEVGGVLEETIPCPVLPADDLDAHTLCGLGAAVRDQYLREVAVFSERPSSAMGWPGCLRRDHQLLST
jgi:hypothetical protein